jgi:hypothetical protein
LTSSEFSKEDGNSQFYGIAAQYVFYPNPNPKVNLYLGSGPSVSYSRFTQDDTREGQGAGQGGTVLISRSGSGWSVGLSNVLGVEWFVAKNISLSAENRFLIAYRSTKTEQSIESDTGSGVPGQSSYEQQSTSYIFQPTKVILGVTAYF